MQAKLLTLLDSRRFWRVGAVRPIEVDVRFIAATNRILLGRSRRGLFRDDLYYRLQVVAINIPPLRMSAATTSSCWPGVAGGLQPPAWQPDDELRARGRGRFSPLRLARQRARAGKPAGAHLPAGGRRARAAGAPARPHVRQAVGSQQRLRASRGCAIRLPRSHGSASSASSSTARAANGGQNLAEAACALGLSRHALRHQMKKLVRIPEASTETA